MLHQAAMHHPAFFDLDSTTWLPALVVCAEWSISRISYTTGGVPSIVQNSLARFEFYNSCFYHIRLFHISASAVTMMDHQHSLMAGILSPQAGHVRILGDAPTSTVLQSSPLSIQIYIYMHTYVIKAQALYTRPGSNKILPALPSSGAAEAVFHA